MLKNKIKFFCIFLCFVLFSKTSFSIEPNIFVQSTVNRASQILSADINKIEKIKKLKIVANDTVDIKGIGFIGKYRKFKRHPKRKYNKLFTEYF